MPYPETLSSGHVTKLVYEVLLAFAFLTGIVGRSVIVKFDALSVSCLPFFKDVNIVKKYTRVYSIHFMNDNYNI